MKWSVASGNSYGIVVSQRELDLTCLASHAVVGASGNHVFIGPFHVPVAGWVKTCGLGSLNP